MARGSDNSFVYEFLLARHLLGLDKEGRGRLGLYVHLPRKLSSSDSSSHSVPGPNRRFLGTPGSDEAR